MSDKKSRIEKAEWLLGALSWTVVGVILLCVLLTILQLNGIIRWGLFNNYLSLQIALFVGLLIWSVRFYVNSRRYTSYFKFSVFSFVFALIQLIFILFTVY